MTADPGPLPKLTYTPAEVAEMLGTTEWWIREQARRRRIPHLRLGKARILIRRDDISQILELFAIEAQPVQPTPLTAGEHIQMQDDLAVIGLTERSRSLHRRV
jgi:excisionase family DNA binding protein